MEKTTTASRAYQQIRVRIASGDLPEGQKITEAAISDLLGVGRGPARETLLRLEADGLVQRPGPRRARYIKSVEEQSLEDVQHQYELREVVDGLAARKAALAMTGKQILQLREIVAQLEVCLLKKDRKERLRLMHQFYSQIRQQSGNPLLEIALERAGVNTPFFLHADVDAHVLRLLDEHGPMISRLSAVINAISAHDPDLAESEMRQWTRLSWSVVQEAVKAKRGDSAQKA